MIKPDRYAYFYSLAEELHSQANRVRNLIGDKHWLSDGHHKEYLLGSVLSRHLPSNVLMCRGFIVDSMDSSICSKEQDLLIVDTRAQGPLFNQGGLIISLPSTVIATISVKTTMNVQTVKDSVNNLASAKSAIGISGSSSEQQAFFSAAYYFSIDEVCRKKPTAIYKAVASTDVAGWPNLLIGGSELVFRIHQADETVIAGYECGGLATAVFIALIVDYVSTSLGAKGSELTEMVEHHSIKPLNPPQYKAAACR